MNHPKFIQVAIGPSAHFKIIGLDEQGEVWAWGLDEKKWQIVTSQPAVAPNLAPGPGDLGPLSRPLNTT